MPYFQLDAALCTRLNLHTLIIVSTYRCIFIVYVEQTVMSIEEDSEPILGLWFEETLAPSDETSTNTNKETNNEASAERTATTTIVPDNREPHGVRF